MIKKCSILTIVFVLLGILSSGFILAEEVLEFEVYKNYDWASSEEWGDESGEDWIEKNQGFRINVVSAQGAANQKLSTMMVSDEYPDVIWLDRGQNVQRLVDAGKLVALDPWLEDSNLMEWAGPATLNLLRSDDGKLYQFPNWYLDPSSPNGNSGWVINQEIYQGLGSPKLENFTDLYQYLQLVKEEYDDIIPFETLFDFQGVDYVYSGMGEKKIPQFMTKFFAYPEGDNLNIIFDDPVFEEAMLYINKLFREGLLTQDGFTQTSDQAEEKLNAGRVAVAAAGDIVNPAGEATELYLNPEGHAGYLMISPISKEGLDKDNVYTSMFNALGWNVNIITKDAEDPEAIFKALDWMTSPEGQRVLSWGPQGEYWDELTEDGVPIPNEAYQNASPEEIAEAIPGGMNLVGNTSFVDGAKIKREMMLPEDKRSWVAMAQYNYTWNTTINGTEFSNIVPLANTDEGRIYQKMEDLYDEYFAKMVFANTEEEVLKLIEEARSEFIDIGADRVYEYMENKWQENVELMGEGVKW